MRLVYSALLYALLPLMVLRMLWRSRRAPAYRERLAERLGFFEPLGDGRPAIWVHAVSVGETLAAAPLVETLLQRYPQYQVVVTTTTPTGSERVRALFGERVFHVYAPWDTPGAVRRFMRRTRPALLLVMETELWPNLLHYAARGDCPVILANARLSARSARGYQRVAGLTRAMLGCLSVVACQARLDGDRFVALGLAPDALQITGSIKFDIDLDPTLRQEVAQMKAALARDARPVIVVASTHPGEDEQVLAAFKQVLVQQADCLLVLVPRHPERFDTVYELCLDAGLSVCRRSLGSAPADSDQVLLGDTMGELLKLLGCADLAVIGGSLVEHGGHNALEASAWGVAVVTGPYMFNFAEIADLLEEAGAMLRLEQPQDLSACLPALLLDVEKRQVMGAAGLSVVEANRGASERLLALVDGCLRET
ncbi:MAG: lipid IV(A) 3-deoxy-D-manno-octulosonic acid transferase [Pseudomonadota bacterium]